MNIAYPETLINIIHIGKFSGPSGYATATRGYFEILRKNLKLNIKVINVTEGHYGMEPVNLNRHLLKSKKDTPKEYITLYHMQPGEKFLNEAIKETLIDIKSILNNSQKKIMLTAWEAVGFPYYWKSFFDKYVDELVTFCEFQSKNLSSYTGKKVYSIPHLVKAPQASNTVPSQKLRMLSMSEWSYRKGFDILVQAFLCEFFEEKDVELTIKTYGVEESKENIIRQIQKYKKSCGRHGELPKCVIKLWGEIVNPPQINTLYDNIDLYVSTTRGEGFGLTIAEALVRGKRAVVPAQGGHLDYIHSNNYFIKSRLETFRGTDWSANYSSEFKLIEPDFEDTRVKLRQAYNDFKNNKQEWANKQKESQAFTRNYLEEETIKTKLEEVLWNQTGK